MKPSKTAQNLAILAITLLAFLLRAYRLDFQSYWIDEAWTVYHARLSLLELLQRLLTVEPHPPLYFPSLLYWVKLVGDGEYALRFYSLVFGVLAVPFTYRLGKDTGGVRLGLIAALLLALAPFQVWYAQEARMYSLLIASAAMSMWGFVNLWQRGSRRWWFVYIVGTTWLMLSHYHGLVVIGSQGLFLLLAWRRRLWRRYLAWSSALLVVFLLYLPWLAFSWNLLRHRTSWTQQPGFWEIFVRSAIAYSVGEWVSRPLAIFLTLAFVALYLVGLVYAARRPWQAWRGREMLALLLASTVAPILAAWLYGEWRTPVYLERYLIPVQLGYLLAVALGILAVADSLPVTRFRSRRPGYAVAAGLLLLLVGIDGWVLRHHYADPAYARPDWRATARTIESYSLPGDAVVLTGDGSEKAFGFYYRGKLPVYYPFNTPVPAETEARRLIHDIAARHPRLWYVPYGAPIDTTLEAWLAEQTYPAWQSWLGRKRLALYAGSQVIPGRLETVNRVFTGSAGQELALLSVALPGQAIPAGDLLPLLLTWQSGPGLSANYQLSLRLANDRGDLFAQSDWPPLAAAGPTSTWPPGRPITDRRSLWLPPDLPPGSYLLQLVVYDPATGQPLGQPAALPGVAVGPARLVVPLAALPVPNPTHQPLGDLTLVGYAVPDVVRPGEEMWAWLYWQARQPPGPDTTLSLWLKPTGDPGGEAPPVNRLSLADSLGPPDSWLPGQVRRAVYHLPTSPRLQGDRAELQAALSGGEAGTGTTLFQVKLHSRERQFKPPGMAQPADLAFGQPPLLKLIGYDLPQKEAGAGSKLPVTLYWQAQAEMQTSYTVFVQLLNEQNQVLAQVDALPLAGAAPTTTWLPGEILTDLYQLSLPPALPPGRYRLIAGLYNAANGERLPVSSQANFVELSQVTVK